DPVLAHQLTHRGPGTDAAEDLVVFKAEHLEKAFLSTAGRVQTRLGASFITSILHPKQSFCTLAAAVTRRCGWSTATGRARLKEAASEASYAPPNPLPTFGRGN